MNGRFLISTCAILAVLGLCPSVASAQAVTATSGVSFPASADHNTVVLGAPAVVTYQLDVVAQNPLGAIGFSFGLGKPAPDASNTITVKPIASFGALASGVYTATVTAVGPGGNGKSPASAPFPRLGPAAAPGQPTVLP